MQPSPQLSQAVWQLSPYSCLLLWRRCGGSTAFPMQLEPVILFCLEDDATNHDKGLLSDKTGFPTCIERKAHFLSTFPYVKPHKPTPLQSSLALNL